VHGAASRADKMRHTCANNAGDVSGFINREYRVRRVAVFVGTAPGYYLTTRAAVLRSHGVKSERDLPRRLSIFSRQRGEDTAPNESRIDATEKRKKEKKNTAIGDLSEIGRLISV